MISRHLSDTGPQLGRGSLQLNRPTLLHSLLDCEWKCIHGNTAKMDNNGKECFLVTRRDYSLKFHCCNICQNCTKCGVSHLRYILISWCSRPEVNGKVVSLLQATRLQNESVGTSPATKNLPQGDQNWLLYVRNPTTSSHFCGDKLGSFLSRPGDVSSHSCGNQNRYSKLKHDVFLAISNP